MLKLSYNKVSNATALASGSHGGCQALQRLELQGNKLTDIKNLPEGLPNLQVLYLQEFDGSGQNPIC